jgi:hypothetical protein
MKSAAERYAKEQERAVLQKAATLMRAGKRLKAIAAVRTWLRDCHEPSRFNDAIDWANIRGLCLGEANSEWPRHVVNRAMQR